jgi:hypothetical protein
MHVVQAAIMSALVRCVENAIHDPRSGCPRRLSPKATPRSAWRKDVVPKPRVVGGSPSCESHADTNGGALCAALDGRQSPSVAVPASAPGARAEWLAPNVLRILRIRHWSGAREFPRGAPGPIGWQPIVTERFPL